MPGSTSPAMHVYALHDGTKATQRRAEAIAATLKAKSIHVSFFVSLERNSLRPASWEACLVLLTREYLRLVNGGEEPGSAARALLEASTASSVPKIVVALEPTLPTQLPGAVGERLGSPMTLSLHEDPECAELERVIRLQRPRSAFRGACRRVLARNRLVLLEAKRKPPPVPSTQSSSTQSSTQASEFRARVKRIAEALDIASNDAHLGDVVDRAIKTLRVRCGPHSLFCERVVTLEKHLGLV